MKMTACTVCDMHPNCILVRSSKKPLTGRLYVHRLCSNCLLLSSVCQCYQRAKTVSGHFWHRFILLVCFLYLFLASAIFEETIQWAIGSINSNGPIELTGYIIKSSATNGNSNKMAANLQMRARDICGRDERENSHSSFERKRKTITSDLCCHGHMDQTASAGH